MAKKTAMDCVKLARDPKRPHIWDFIGGVCSDFEELRGDRLVSDDRALIGGFATIGDEKVLVLGHHKGANVEENLSANFGMVNWLFTDNLCQQYGVEPGSEAFAEILGDCTNRSPRRGSV